jgi:hypothetical protein
MSGCPTSRILTNETGQCSAVATWTTPIATDNCNASLPVTCVPPSGSRFSKGSTLVSCSTADGAGNSGFCLFVVTVVDREAPQLSDCPADVSVVAEAGNCTAIVSWAPPTALDRCDGPVAVTCVPASGSVFNVGHTPVICTARDATNNSATCSFTVTVKPHPNDVPVLDILLQGPAHETVVVSWLRICSDLYQLEEASDLNSTTAWVPVVDPITLEGDRFVLRRSAALPARCYRLRFR